MEAIIWPMQRPDLFTGLRTVPKGAIMAVSAMQEGGRAARA